MRAVASSLKTSPVPPAGPTLQRLPPLALRYPDCSGGTSGSVALVVAPATVVVVAPPAVVVVEASLGTVVEAGELEVGVEAVVVVVLSVLVRLEGPPAAVVVGATVVGAPVVAASAIVVVLAPATVVVVVVVSGFLLGSEVTHGRLNWSSVRTGRRYTCPVTLTNSSACAWFLTPGRLTTTASPWRRISGSATPRLSTRSRIRSTARSRLDVLKSPTGFWVMEMPPCRSRPSDGESPLATVRINP